MKSLEHAQDIAERLDALHGAIRTAYFHVVAIDMAIRDGSDNGLCGSEYPYPFMSKSLVDTRRMLAGESGRISAVAECAKRHADSLAALPPIDEIEAKP